MLELCAGSAMLSRCFHEQGFTVMPVDHQQNRFHPLAKICNMSLTLDSSWKYLFWLVSTFAVVFCHAAPPCGTCSRARELPGGPPPLRNEVYPWGFDDLSPDQRARVDAANKIYIGLAKFVEFLILKGVFFAIENPENSLLWLLPIWTTVFQHAFIVTFDACVYGGQRKTSKTFLTNVPQLRAMAQKCNGGHTHLPFGRQKVAPGKYAYATAEEAAYPRPLCLQIVSQVCAALNIDMSPISEPSVPTKAFAGSVRLPRGRKVPPLVPEFSRVTKVVLDELPQVNSKRCILHCIGDIPPGSKFLSHTLLNGDDLGDERNNNNNKFQCMFGVYHSKDEFLEKSLWVLHPFDSMCPLKDELLKVLFNIVTKGPLWVVEKRKATLTKWLGFAKELGAQEADLHKSLEPSVAQVLAGKRLLLLQKLASDVGWPDVEIFGLMRTGFDLVGNASPSGVFDVELRPAELTVDELFQTRRFMRPALLGKTSSAKLDGDSKELWDKTCKEADGRLLKGPYSVSEVDAIFADGWTPVRRFGVRQSSGDTTKLRPIDDYSECKVNQAFGYADKIDLRALDELVWVLRAWMRWMATNDACEVVLSCGTRLCGPVHSSWSMVDASPQVTTLDLHAAYKQLAISPSSRSLSVVVLPNPDLGGIGCFVGNALPFGSTASVVYFNRIARLVWRLGLELLLPWCNYYDDYPIFAPACVAASTMSSMIGLVKLLGFSYSEDKLHPFGSTAAMLGVEVDCGPWKEGHIVVRNKESRAKEIQQLVSNLTVGEHLTSREFLSIVGRLQFAEAQVMGRLGKLALSRIRTWMSQQRILVTRELLEEFRMLGERFRREKPREIPMLVDAAPVLVLTDGASEEGCHTIGGVLVFPDENEPRFFGSYVPDALVEKWFSTMKHIIGPVEAYALLVARAVWHKHLVGRRCIFFVDNYGAMDAFIKGSSSNAELRELLLCFEKLECNGFHWPWFTRVPSVSNCADDPTRVGGVLGKFLIAALRDSCLCPLTGKQLADFVSTTHSG